MRDSSSYTLIYLALTYLIFPPGVLQVVKGGGTFGLPPPAPHLWIGSIVYELCREKCDQTTLHQSGLAPELRGSTIPPPPSFSRGIKSRGGGLHCSLKMTITPSRRLPRSLRIIAGRQKIKKTKAQCVKVFP